MIHKNKVHWQLSYIDYLSTLVAVTSALFFLALWQVNPSKNDSNSQRNAELMVITEWTDDLCDVDLEVKDPTGAIVYYQNKVSGLAHLEFDDRGNVNSEEKAPDGTKIVSHDHHEYWVIRGIIPGTYHTSVHLFTCRGKDGDVTNSFDHGVVKDIKAKITIEDLNPQLVVADVRDVVMHKIWDETVGADFDVNADGSIVNVSDGVQPIVMELIDKMQSGVSGSGVPSLGNPNQTPYAP